MGKVMTTADAIQTFVDNSNFLFIGGYVCRPPFAAIHEIFGRRFDQRIRIEINFSREDEHEQVL